MNHDFKNLPETWELVLLGDFVESEKGKKPKNQNIEESPEYCYPYVDIEAFEDGIIKSYTDGKNCRLCYESDFLMVWDGSRSGLVGKGMTGALGSTLVRINFPHILNSYAYYFLRSKYLQINSRAKGSGTPHVDPDLLWNYQFPIPPVNEQHRIVAKIEELFSELDKGIESLKTAREQLKVYRQALLKHAFEGKLTEQWRKDNADKLESADDLLARIQQERETRYQQQLGDWTAAVKQWEDKGKDGKKPSKPAKIKKEKDYTGADYLIPNNWGVLELEYLAFESVLGKMLDKKKNSGVPRAYLGNINVRWGKFNLENMKSMKIEDTEVKRYSLSKGDLVICEGGEPGRCAVWQGTNNSIFVQKALHRVRFTRSYNPMFAFYFLVYSVPIRYVTKYFTGTTIKHLTGAGLKRIQFPVCSLLEQKKIVNLLGEKFLNIDSMILDIEHNIFKSETLRQSILKKAFSGQLVPQDPSDEPASILLARIKVEKAEQDKQAKARKTTKRKLKA